MRELKSLNGEILLGGDEPPIFVGTRVNFVPVPGAIRCGDHPLDDTYTNAAGEVVCRRCHRTVAHVTGDVETFE
jgi:hypothetical protein